MEAANLREVIKMALGGTGPARGRLFIICISKEHMLIALDGRPHPDPDFSTYTNIFVPTICGNCAYGPKSRKGTASTMEISENILERSAAFGAVKNWCNAEIQVVRIVEDREWIANECKKYTVHFQGGAVRHRGGGPEELEILPYYDPSFVEGKQEG